MTQPPQRAPAVSASPGTSPAADNRTRATTGIKPEAARSGDGNRPGAAPLTLAVREEVCGRFETAWQAAAGGADPRIEDYLTAVSDEDRPDLLRELVLVDIAFRHCAGRMPKPDEYLVRFPGLERAWLISALSALIPTTLSVAMSGQAGPGGTPTPGSAVPAPPAAAAPPLVLSNRFDDYELLEEIARGGMGVVYKARQVSLGRIVALKMILHQGPASVEGVQRFLREAQAAAALDHPNIVAIHASGQQDGHPFFTMAYVEGENLGESVRRRGLPTPDEATELLRGVTEAVAFAHQHGIIHRDLKPENVLIDRQGRPRVTDFGLAYHLQAGAADRLTLTGQVMGTPAYMSPEQALGKHEAMGPATDIYSLGGILYYMLTRQLPFQGQTVTEILAKVVTAPPIPPRQINSRADARLEAICLRCLDKDPAQRYPSAEALVAALDAARAETQGRPPSGRPGAARGWSRRTLVGLAAVLLVAVAAGVWLTGDSWWPDSTEPDNSTPARPGPARAAAELPPPKDPRKGFGLAVAVVRKQSKSGGFRVVRPGADGLLQLPEDAEVKFRVKVAQAAYVGIWSIGADGTVLLLFPNDWEEDHVFRPNEERLVPETRAVVEKSAGIDSILIRASTKPWPLGSGPRKGPFPFFKNKQDLAKWRAQQRTIGLRPVETPSSVVLKYRVGPPAER